MGGYINIDIAQCRYKFAFDGDDLVGTSNVLNSLVGYNNNTQIKHKYYGISTGEVAIGRDLLNCGESRTEWRYEKVFFGTKNLYCPNSQQG